MSRFVRTLAAAMVALAVVPAFVAMTSVGAADGLQLRILSSRPDMVTGGDALVRVELPAGMAARDVKLTLNGTDVTAKVNPDAAGRSLTGLVTGFALGTNTLAATGSNKASTRLSVVNHPITGPLFAGPQEQPFVCGTNEFKLQGGGTLGPPLDANCSTATRVDYVYRSKTDGKLKALPDPNAPPADADMVTRDGKTVPFVVRIETGTINRGIYQIAMLNGGWNGRLIYTFGGGCEPGWYQQGDSTGGIDDEVQLRMGYAVASNTLNVLGNDCSAVISAETMAMTKEHFIEAYGVPAFTIGWGSSGGSTQQHEIAENYPGLLDGLMTGRSFADNMFASSTSSGEGRLFEHYFDKVAAQKYTDDQILAVTGFPVVNTMHNLSRVRAPRFTATEACPMELAAELRYDPVKNPKGARCSFWDHSVNVYGRDPKTGFARRPLDNVGIQYRSRRAQHRQDHPRAISRHQREARRLRHRRQHGGRADGGRSGCGPRGVSYRAFEPGAWWDGQRADHRLSHLLRRCARRRRPYAVSDVHDRRASTQGDRYHRQPRDAHPGQALWRLPDDQPRAARGPGADGSVAGGVVEGCVERSGDREDSACQARRPG